LREIGTIAEEKAARVLEDHLLTLGISTKLDPIPEGIRVWVHREDRVDEARAVLGEFLKAPDDPRFQAATREARAIRKKAELVEAEYRGNVQEMTERWGAPFHRRAPLCALLLAISVVVAVATNLGKGHSGLMEMLSFSTFTVELVDGNYVIRDHGFENIEHGELWRLVTPIFLHFDPFHLVFNMLWLVSLGGGIEGRKRWKKVGLIVLTAAILGNVGQYFESGGLFGGMSGVVYALFGYVWAKGHADPEDGFSASPNTVLLMVAWFLFGIASRPDVTPDMPIPRLLMGNAAHGVGLAVGIAFGLLRF